MKQLLISIFLVAFLTAPAIAQQPGGPVAAGQAMAQANDQGHVSIIAVPQPQDTTVSFGTLGAQILGWLAAVFVPVLATFLTKLLINMAQKAGVQASQAMSDRLDGIIENGLHSGSIAIEHDITGKLDVNVKSQAVNDAVGYAQAHAADTIKSLTGKDVDDPKVIEALQARAAKVLSNIVAQPVAVPAPAPQS